MIAGFAALSGTMKAQGPMYDKVIVDLPYQVTLNDTVLQPGHYVIRQFESVAGGSRILQIYTDNGMKLKTTTMTIPALDNNTPENTKVILHHYGNDYYFDKIWIQGKNYGYEFPLPDAVKSRQREKMEPYTVAAKYEPTSQTTETVASSETTTTTPAPVAAAEVAPTPAPVASTTDTTTTTTTAQNTAPADTSSNTGNSGSNTNTMPHTAADWLGMLLSGGVLSGAGLMLRRAVR